ncbi:MAG: hypothetical protein K0S94_2575, partial [Nitrospira sp.]|jgi:hypothetical protein|nr:hypothetical protein [Nitrospira sp.]
MAASTSNVERRKEVRFETALLSATRNLRNNR